MAGDENPPHMFRRDECSSWLLDDDKRISIADAPPWQRSHGHLVATAYYGRTMDSHKCFSQRGG